MHELLKRYGTGLTGAFVLLTAFWLLILLILPNLTMFESSFRPYLPVVDVGGPLDTYSLNNYMKVFGVPVDAGTQASLASTLVDLASAVGGLLAIWGRIKATHTVR